MIDKKMEILKSGRELFSSKGFKDTSVSEITKMAGIATGTFYLYFTSKESLFMDLFLEENIKLKKAILEMVDPNRPPLIVIQELMQQNVEGITSNPILREWYNKDVFARIEEKYREENGLEHVDFLYQSYVEIVKKWQVEGKLRDDIDSEMIMAIFAAVIIIDTHKEEIGLQFFPKIQDYMMEFIMNGLTPHSKQRMDRGESEG